MLKHFWNDERGFVVSAELVLIATLLVIGLIVGLAEVQSAVVQELNDVGEAIGRTNQSYFYSGFQSFKTFFGGLGFAGTKSFTAGSAFFDGADDCDYNECALSCFAPTAEAGRGRAAVSQTTSGTVTTGRSVDCAPSTSCQTIITE